MNSNAPIARPNERDILSTRLLDAPRDLVWEAWTNPKHVLRWWGPRGFTNTNKEMTVKVGGVWRFTMHGMGHDFPNKITYREVKKPERLVFSHGDDTGAQDDFEVTVTFAEEGSKTRVTFAGRFSSVEERDRVIKEHHALEGNVQTLDRMEEHIARMQAEAIGAQFEIRRLLEAPRSLVWKALSEPERLAHWWGPKGFEMKSQSMTFRAGGTYHYVVSSPAQTMWGLFRYREIVPEEKILFTNSFSDDKGNIVRAGFSENWPLEVLNEQNLAAEGRNRTRLTLVGFPIHANEKEREMFKGMHESMQGGFGASFDQLDRYLKTAG